MDLRLLTGHRIPASGATLRASTVYSCDFTLFENRILLQDVFERRDTELRNYFVENKAAAAKERLFYVIQSGRLQCLNGAYLSEASRNLARLILDGTGYTSQQPMGANHKTTSTGELVRGLLTRLGQSEFSGLVRENYGSKCCFPGCDVAERTFLRGSHIARWADAPELRGDIANGLCLCLMHDQAFERGLFTVDLEMRIWVNPDKAKQSPWTTSHLLPHHKQTLRLGAILPSEEALLQHWERTSCYPA